MNLRKIFSAALAAAVAIGCGVITALAANSPNIKIKPSGMENQYIVSLENVASTAHGVQFDITVETGKEVEVQWADVNVNVVQEAVQKTEGNKTTLTFYVSKTYPLSNSTKVNIATITTTREQKENSFSTSGQLKTVDGSQRATTYTNVTLKAFLAEDRPIYQENDGYDDYNDYDDDDSSQNTNISKPKNTWETLSQKVKTVNGKKTLSINAKAGERLESLIFRQILKEGVELIVDYGDYQWFFEGTEGGSVPEKQRYYDLTVITMNQQNLSAATQNSDVLQFDVVHGGSFPCPASLKINIGEGYKGQTLYLAKYDEFAGTLEKQAEITTLEDCSVILVLEQGGKYVITETDLWKASAVSTEGTAQPPMTVTVPPLTTETEQEENQKTSESLEEDESETDSSEDEEDTKETSAKPPKKEDKKGNTAVIIIAICCVLILGGIVAFIITNGAKKSRRRK